MIRAAAVAAVCGVLALLGRSALATPTRISTPTRGPDPIVVATDGVHVVGAAFAPGYYVPELTVNGLHGFGRQ